MVRYGPPANHNDFKDSQSIGEEVLAKGWHDNISGWVQSEIGALPRRIRRFIHGVDVESKPIGIPWDAFPQTITGYLGRGKDAYRAAETPAPTLAGTDENGQQVVVFTRQQDEYCEWFCHRDGAGRIFRVDFTCEGPEYWEHIGQDHQLILALYKKYVSDEVELPDLLWDRQVDRANGGEPWIADQYNPFNEWNTTRGAMHLTHPANTLGAEINLAARATILRSTDGGRTIVNTVQELACCSPFGEVNRSSDPNIGLGVNRLVQAGKEIALANPIGLYIADLPMDDIVDGDGNPAATWTIQRGQVDEIDGETFPRILRARVDIPTDRDVTIGGIPLDFGGQIAERIRMVLYGVGRDAPDGKPEPQEPEQKCCQHPRHPTIRGIQTNLQADCTVFNWARFDQNRAPFLEADDGPQLAAAGAPPVPHLSLLQSTRVPE
jgi:hypothetical protein